MSAIQTLYFLTKENVLKERAIKGFAFQFECNAQKCFSSDVLFEYLKHDSQAIIICCHSYELCAEELSKLNNHRLIIFRHKHQQNAIQLEAEEHHLIYTENPYIFSSKLFRLHLYSILNKSKNIDLNCILKWNYLEERLTDSDQSVSNQSSLLDKLKINHAPESFCFKSFINLLEPVTKIQTNRTKIDFICDGIYYGWQFSLDLDQIDQACKEAVFASIASANPLLKLISYCDNKTYTVLFLNALFSDETKTNEFSSNYNEFHNTQHQTKPSLPATKSQVMRLKFLGVRGSRPTHKIDLLNFGGNSTSIQFVLPEEEEINLFLDGGSGVAHHSMQKEWKASERFVFLITHTHWDHILGFPFFTPFYNSENEITFYASATSKATFNQLFFGLQRSNNLPIPQNILRAKINFESILPEVPFKVSKNAVVETYQINHQGVTLAYRVNYKNDSAAVVTDNAPIENGNYLGELMHQKAEGDPQAFENAFNEGLIRFLKNCHTVVFDTHFTEDNLKPDWGHSTPQRALDFCIKAGVKRLILFHHAPEDLDQHVKKKVESVVEFGAKNGVEVVAAKEGDEWTLHLE